MVLEGAKCLEMDLDYKWKGRLKSTKVFIVYKRGSGFRLGALWWYFTVCVASTQYTVECNNG